MFGLFTRTKLKDNEIKLLYSVLKRLTSPYCNLYVQIDDNLLKGVLLNASDIPGYVAFTFNSQILKKYDNERERDYKLCNIEVFDNKLLRYVNYEIYISSGTISGYSWLGNTKFDVDFNRINTNNFKLIFTDISDYKKIEHIFSEREKTIINPSNIFSVFLDKEYFHLKDLEDGDFIGVDFNKKLYKITHDPMEVKAINETIEDIFA